MTLSNLVRVGLLRIKLHVKLSDLCPKLLLVVEQSLAANGLLFLVKFIRKDLSPFPLEIKVNLQ